MGISLTNSDAEISPASQLVESVGIYLVVAPCWDHVFWRPDLKSQAIAPPILLRRLERHLIDLSTSRPPLNVPLLRLEGTGWIALTHGWPTADRRLLASAWGASTLTTYHAPWQRWMTWTARMEVAANDPSPQGTSLYLSYLHRSEGLSYRTILVHKSVVTTFAFANLSTGPALPARL